MREPKFQWGPVARGIYIGMLWFTVVIGWHFPNFLAYYIPLLIFLGLALRPLLEMTGLYDLYVTLSERIDESRWKKITEQRREEVRRMEKNKKYKSMRVKHPNLPKDW